MSELREILDELKGLTKTLVDASAQRSEEEEEATDGQASALTEEKVRSIMLDVLEKQRESAPVLNRQNGRVPFEVDEDSEPLMTAERSVRSGKPVLRKSMFLTSAELGRFMPTERVADLQGFKALSDDVYIMSVLRKRHPSRLLGEEGAVYEHWMQERNRLTKALDTQTSGEGADWIPTEFSAEVMELIHLPERVPALFDRFTMPSGIYRYPIQTSDATAYYITESLHDSSTKIRASTPTSSNIVFTARKLAARSVLSEEYIEDSIIPALPDIKQRIALAMQFAEAHAIINGDRAATMDTAVPTDDASRAWNGLRYMARNGSSTSVDTNNTWNVSQMRTIRRTLGRYGVVAVGSLAWIVGPSQGTRIADFDDVQTLDKYGPNATIFTGEVAKVDGIPVITSEQVREDLNSSGVYDAAVTTDTQATIAYRPALKVGDRRIVRIKTDENIETDQTIVVATERLDFQAMFDYTSADFTIVAEGYDITV